MPSTTNISRARRIRAMDSSSYPKCNQFRDQRVVIRRDYAVSKGCRIHANSGTSGVRNTVIRPADGTNVSGSSAFDAAFHGVPARRRDGRHIFELFPIGKPYLGFDQIHAVTISVTGCSTWMRAFISMK